jgi:hypothetical protein
MESTVFWDITPCSTLKVNRRFGKHRLHLQGRISRAIYQRGGRWLEDSILHNHLCENLRLYREIIFLQNFEIKLFKTFVEKVYLLETVGICTAKLSLHRCI